MNSEEKINSRNDNNKRHSLNIQYPFIKMKASSLAMNKNTFFIGKIKNSDKIINTQLDQLLLTGFEGSEEDFRNIYNRHEPKKKIKLKIKKLNRSLLTNPDITSKSIKLTKIKEFNHTDKHRYKGLKKILNELENKRKKENETKLDENNYKNKSGIYFQSKNASSIGLNSYNTKTYSMGKYINSTKEKEKHAENKMKRIIKIRKMLKQKNNAILPTLNNSFKKINDKKLNINQEKHEKEENSIQDQNKSYMSKSLASLKTSKNKTNKNKDKKIVHEVNKIFEKYLGIRNDKEEQTKLKKVLDPLQNNFKSNLKEVQKYIGNNRENIWMKKSTANLISFGTSFMMISDDIFLREHKRIINKYPELEKEAQLSVPFYKVKKNKTIEKMEKNEKKIKNICSENEVLLRGINRKWKEQKILRSQSQYLIKPKIKN